jgi:hypothetical protein
VFKPNFVFAGYVAALMTVATFVVAAIEDLPIRDPQDLAGPSFVRLPVILLLAFLVDVVPRALRSNWRAPAAALSAFRDVTRERWGRAHVLFALSGLGVWYVTYVAFRNLKSYVPFVNPKLWDNELAGWDRTLWLGNDPANVLHSVFGTGWAAHFFSFVYLLWLVLVPITLVVALMWTRHIGAGAWYVTAATIDWALGAATYFIAPSLGPIYSAPGDFKGMPDTWASNLQGSMIDDRHDMLADPFGTPALQSIAAFASLHIGMLVTICLIAHLIGLPRWVKVSCWLFLALTEIATIYLGWHFFVDTIGGAAIGILGLWIAAIVTGNHVNGRPVLMARQLQPAEPAYDVSRPPAT